MNSVMDIIPCFACECDGLKERENSLVFQCVLLFIYFFKNSEMAF